MKRARGMSLVEMLVAMLLLSLMTVMGWRALDGILASRVALTAQLDAMRGHQLAFAQLEADCAQLLRSAAVDGLPTLSATQGRLVLLRSASGEGGADQMQVVVYQADGAQLTRSTSAATRDFVPLRQVWKAAVSGVAPLAGAALDRQLSAFELRTWNGGAWQPVAAATNAAGPRLRTRRLVRPAVTDALGLQVILRPVGSVAPLTRMFMLGGG
ncbi:type II secretion system protein J [Duganella sp. BuS-21]|uniref:PulJ/GspJ family protein n=1 Tax=Duganella sp. BuS-21 TaxID=2943848 RepID=UPI0035A685D1